MSEQKISDELMTLIKGKLESPGEKIKVIVTISKDVPMESVKNELIKNGLIIETMIPGPVQVVSGTISANEISQLAQVGGVEIIEYDSMFYAQ